MKKTDISAEELLEKYSNMVYRLAYARTGNVDDAQDIVQEVFLKYIKANKEQQLVAGLIYIDNYADGASLSAALYQKR